MWWKTNKNGGLKAGPLDLSFWSFLTLYGPYILESVVHDGFAFSASCAFVSSAPGD